jgi:hypothetical protein
MFLVCATICSAVGEDIKYIMCATYTYFKKVMLRHNCMLYYADKMLICSYLLK